MDDNSRKYINTYNCKMHKLACSFIIFFFLNCSYCAAQRSTTLMTYNIRNAKGMDNTTDYERTALVIKNAKADIVALQEVDSATVRSKREDVLKNLSEKTGLFRMYGAAIPYQEGKYGVGILSRRQPSKYYTVPLPGNEEKRVLLVAVFKKYVIFCTHLSLTEADRLSSVLIINKEAAKFQKPIYLLGDMNAEPTSASISILKERWKLLSGEEFSFPATVPNKCIDYIFTSNNRKAKVISKKVIGEPMASDHRPVLVEVGK